MQRMNFQQHVRCSLREFPNFKPVNIWFNYPVHMVDATGVLQSIYAKVREMLISLSQEKESKQRKTVKRSSMMHLMLRVWERKAVQ